MRRPPNTKKSQSLRTLSDYTHKKLINPADLAQLKKVANNFSLAMSAKMASLIDKNNLNDPIAKQFVPATQELNISPPELHDPIGDQRFTVVKGIIHRYPDRCLFSPV